MKAVRLVIIAVISISMIGVGIFTVANMSHKKPDNLSVPVTDNTEKDGGTETNASDLPLIIEDEDSPLEEGSEDITLTFDKAYTALDNTLVKAYIGGAEKAADVAYNKEAKTLTISNLERKAGDVVKIVISKDATMDVDSVENVDGLNAQAMVATAIGEDVETVIYTTDANGLWTMPFENVYGTDDVTVYAKYINGGEEQSKKMFLGTYGANGLLGVKYQTKTFSPASKGLISINGLAGDYTQGESWKASLWNADMTPYMVSVGE